MGFVEFLAVASQNGLWYAIAAAFVVTALLVWRGRSDTRNHVEKTEADSIGVLAKGLTDLGAGLTASNESARLERQQTLLSIEKMTGRMEGMMTVIVDNTKESRATKTAIGELGNQIDEFGTRIQYLPQIKTELHELVQQAASFNGALDERFGPVIALLMGFGNQLTNLSTQGITIIDLITHLTDLTLDSKGQSNETPIQTEID